MHTHRLSCPAQLYHEAVLHQRFTTADRKTARHDFQPVSIFVEPFDGTFESHRDSIDHVPRIRVVAVQAAPLTTRRPRDDAHAWSINRRSGGEGMNKAHVSGFEGVF